MLKSRTTMKAATRIRASWRGRRLAGAGGAVPGETVAGGAVTGGTVAGRDSRRLRDVAVGMIPIRYVTDRFEIPEGRTGR
jgi:hypothetical protein